MKGDDEPKRNGGEWTTARYVSFVKGGLRSLSQRWPPRNQCINNACVGTRINPSSGRSAKHYKCAACGGEFVRKEVEANHINPVVPVTGFDSWTGVIERLLCELDGWEALCKPCHKKVSATENAERKVNRLKRKSK